MSRFFTDRRQVTWESLLTFDLPHNLPSLLIVPQPSKLRMSQRPSGVVGELGLSAIFCFHKEWCQRTPHSGEPRHVALSNTFAYLITLSALTNTFGGIVRPICLAVLRLMKNSNFVGNSVGRSAGLAPLRILSTCTGIRLYSSSRLGP